MVTSSRRAEAGVSYVELVATAAILLVIAAALGPMARVTNQRRKEIELRRALREIRSAINEYQCFADPRCNSGPKNQHIQGDAADQYLPEKLEDLVKGKPLIGDAAANKYKALRRIPIDPMTNSNDWGLRCWSDDPKDSSTWGGTCTHAVWDVFTKAKGKGLDGTPYRDF